jgi:hypothetical protein
MKYSTKLILLVMGAAVGLTQIARAQAPNPATDHGLCTTHADEVTKCSWRSSAAKAAAIRNHAANDLSCSCPYTDEGMFQATF